MFRIGSFDQDYVILSQIGEGSFGTVFKVKHKSLGIERALKVIPRRKDAAFSPF